MNEGAQTGLLQLLSENVVEVQFRRRNPKGGVGSIRSMLCTNNALLLNSILGKTTLHFKPPKGRGLGYDPRAKGLLVTWDILMQDYRQIPLESVNVLEARPLKTKEDIAKFWVFFNDVLSKMSASQKLQFMDR